MTASSHRLAALFVLLTVIPVAALGWVGWRLLQTERTSEARRQQERLEAGADQFARDLDRALGRWEESLTQPDTPAGTVVLELGDNGLTARRGVPLPYYPHVSPASDAPPALLAAAETAEFQSKSEAAVDTYRSLGGSSNRDVRAAALVRLARTLRNQGRLEETLAAYEALIALDGVSVFGYPAELLGRQQRVLLLNGSSREQAAREASRLGDALADGRYIIDRATFDLLRESAHERTIDTVLAEAAEAVVPAWRQSVSGRHSWTRDSRTFVTAWRTRPEGAVGIIGPIERLLDASGRTSRELQFTLENSDGQPIWGTRPAGASVARRAVDLGLPWTVRSAFVDSSAVSGLAASRQRLLTGGVVIVMLVVAATGYVGYRAVSRELSVARLQSEFVATVSHEFRTPLTAMRHLTDLLEEGGVAPERQSQYFRAVGKESRRLHAMVESLLDFGRIESGRRTYAMDATSASDVARLVVEELGSPRVVLDTSPVPPIRGDREALSLALRNLIDNAMKYSPDASPVHVSVGPRGNFAEISVQDQGAGIPREEQRSVFRKFVRGQSARAMNVKGTGLGLTMADQIVRAHGGRLELVSEPSHGARFTMLLPVHQG